MLWGTSGFLQVGGGEMDNKRSKGATVVCISAVISPVYSVIVSIVAGGAAPSVTHTVQFPFQQIFMDRNSNGNGSGGGGEEQKKLEETAIRWNSAEE